MMKRFRFLNYLSVLCLLAVLSVSIAAEPEKTDKEMIQALQGLHASLLKKEQKGAFLAGPRWKAAFVYRGIKDMTPKIKATTPEVVAMKKAFKAFPAWILDDKKARTPAAQEKALRAYARGTIPFIDSALKSL